MKKYHLYVVLTRSNTIISKLIHLIKNDEYTHSAISLDKNFNRMYSFGRKYTFNPFIGRFKEESLNTGLYKFHNNLPGLIMEIEVSKEQYERARELIDGFISNKDLYIYNYKGLVYGLFNKETKGNEYRFLCSEFVYYILKTCNIVDFGMPRNLVRPQTLLNIRGNVFYKGNLKELVNLSNIDNHPMLDLQEVEGLM